MQVTLSQIRRATLILLVAVLSFLAGWFANEKGFALDKLRNSNTASFSASSATPRADMKLFWQVWDLVHTDYFDKTKIDNQKLLYGAIKGMVAAIGDPYTTFLPPEEQKRIQEDLGGAFEGVGIQIGFKGSRLAVIAPLKNTPAEKAGIKAGDFIVGIKDKNKGLDVSTVGMTLIDAVQAIRGPAGTPVTLVVTRDGVDKLLEIAIVRDKIEVPSVELNFVGKKNEVAHLKLFRFGGNTAREWENAVEKIIQSSAKGLILDLRNNPGGYLDGAVSIISEFIPKGVAVIQEGSGGNKKQISVSGRGRLFDISMVVLVNTGSASASEIVAGALKDYKRATVVGESTFGKGTIQEAKDIDDSGIHITTARWLTPKGEWANEKGITPDVVVKDDPATSADEQLEKALDILNL